MLSFLRPWALWLALAIPIIVILYFLRRRFRARPVGSTFLWRALVRKADTGRRLRFRSLLLLAFQIAAAACAVLAAAGPLWTARTAGKTGTVFILDASASMAALTDAAPSLPGDTSAQGHLEDASVFSVARSALIQALNTLKETQPDSLAMVFLAADGLVPLGKPSSNATAVILSLKLAEPSQTAFDEGAVAAGLSAWLAAQDSTWRVILYSDGGLDGGGRLLYEASQGAFLHQSLGSSRGNLGLWALRVRGTALGGRASVLVRNSFPDTQNRRLSLSQGDREVARANLDLPSGISLQSLEFAEPLRYGAWKMELQGGSRPDALAWDDAAQQALQPPRRVEALLVGQSNTYLNAALRMPGLNVTRRPSFPPPEEASSYDFCIADRVAPPLAWPGDLFILGESSADGAAPSAGWVEGPFEAPDPAHPLARHLPLAEAGSYAGLSYAPGAGVSVVARVEGQSVIISWEEAGAGRVACGADLLASGLGSSLAFPILFRNVVQRFAPRSDGEVSWTVETGRSEFFEAPEGAGIHPSAGAAVRRLSGGLEFRAQRPGFWELRLPDGGAQLIAANLPASEQDLGARALSLPEPLPPPPPGEPLSRRSLESHALLLLALFLAAEWLLWNGLALRRKAAVKEVRP